MPTELIVQHNNVLMVTGLVPPNVAQRLRKMLEKPLT